MTINLSYDEASALLLRAVAEKGKEYVYPQSEMGQHHGHGSTPVCSYYVRDGSGWRPSCIIGHLIEYLGLREKFLDERLEGGPGTILLRKLGVTFDSDTEAMLDRVQSAQDEGLPWGKAVEATEVDEW